MHFSSRRKERRSAADAVRRQRIAVIGAGAAGLSAAHYLRVKGYRHITVFDRRPRVGGKCLTKVIDGRSYELGALVVGRCYRRVRELIRSAGLATVPFDPIRLVDTGRPQWTRRAEELLPRGPGIGRRRFLAAYLRYGRRLMRPGYRGMEDTPLAGMTMGAWLQRSGLEPLRPVMAPYYVSWGYGYLEEVSALYVFKLMDFYVRTMIGRMVCPARRAAMGYLVEGYQRLWERIADPFELQLGVDIEAVQRTIRRDAVGDRPGRTEITVSCDGRRRPFDALVLACPLDRAPDFLDADSRERRLMTKIRHLNFYTLTAEVEDLIPGHLVFVVNHLTAAHSGRVVSWYRRWPDSNIIVFYMIGPAGLTEDDLVALLLPDLRALGATLRTVHGCDHWRYFPHVATGDIASGFYRDWEDLQGHRQTWYTGELLAFPTVEHVVAYSHKMVKTFF